jgi:DNA-binding transcriptional LysR family regulator
MRDHVGDLVADGFDLALRFGEPPTSSFNSRKLIETRIGQSTMPLGCGGEA